MQPYDQRQRELADGRGPVAHDQRSQHPGIARIDSVEQMGEPRAHDVYRAQRYDQRTQAPLRQFPGRKLEGTSPIEREQRQEEVDEKGAVEGDLAGQAMPDEEEPYAADFEQAERDQAERMIEQMRDDVSEKDIGRPETDPPDHGATSRAAIPRQAAGRSRRACQPRRWAAAAGSDARRSPWRYRPW